MLLKVLKNSFICHNLFLILIVSGVIPVVILLNLIVEIWGCTYITRQIYILVCLYHFRAEAGGDNSRSGY